MVLSLKNGLCRSHIERSRLPHSIGLIIRTDRWQIDKGSIDYLSIPIEDQGRINTQDFLNLINYRSFIDQSSIFYRSYPDDVNQTNRTLNQLNAIERNRMIAIRLPNAIEIQSNITQDGKFQFDWFDYVRLIDHLLKRTPCWIIK